MGPDFLDIQYSKTCLKQWYYLRKPLQYHFCYVQSKTLLWRSKSKYRNKNWKLLKVIINYFKNSLKSRISAGEQRERRRKYRVLLANLKNYDNFLYSCNISLEICYSRKKTWFFSIPGWRSLPFFASRKISGLAHSTYIRW